MPNELLRALVDCRDRQVQKARIQFGNRASAIDRIADETDGKQATIVDAYVAQFEALEERLDSDIAALVKGEAVYERLVGVKGIGPMLAAKMLAMIDIRQCDTISALWRFAGYGVIDGHAEKPVKGEKLHYSSRLKTTCYLVGSSFLKARSPYRAVYDEARTYYADNRLDWPKLRQHRAAMRKMVKVFLSHLWQVWREMEGLPISDPYIIGEGHHTHLLRPEEFGW